MIAIIAAIAKNNIIGNKRKIPWNILGEQRRFKELTTGNIVIMGRHTFEEIIEKTKAPLKNRITLLLSNTIKIETNNCHTFQSLEEALAWAKKKEPKKDIYIAGGGQVYQDALPYAQRLYLTKIEHVFEGDVYFPNIQEMQYHLVEQEFHQGEISYCYLLYERVIKRERRKMTVKECYHAMKADYEDALKRMGNEERIKKYIKRYLKDPSYSELVNAMRAGNYKEASDAAHTLRGVCKTLSFTEFENSSSRLFELLKMENIEEAEKVLPMVKQDYKRTIALIQKVEQ